jgi:hypothetical protein
MRELRRKSDYPNLAGAFAAREADFWFGQEGSPPGEAIAVFASSRFCGFSHGGYFCAIQARSSFWIVPGRSIPGGVS